MHCPFCRHIETKVIDSRLVAEGEQIRRRRECLQCAERFTTYETAELLVPRVIKQSGVREPFNEEKLRIGLLRALEKRPVGIDKIEAMLMAIKHTLRATGEREVPSRLIGEAVMEQSMKCTAYNGRYLMMGFASDKTKADEPFIVPRRIAAGNLKLCGVLLAYAAPEMATIVKQAMGFNFLSRELGEHITESVVDLVVAGKVRPVVGSVVDFEEIPVAIDAMARRQTTGRTIAMV